MYLIVLNCIIFGFFSQSLKKGSLIIVFMKKFYVFNMVMFVVIFLTSCTPIGDVNPFFLHASDNVKISANFFPANNPSSNKGIILLHMLGKDKTSWNFFVPELTNANYNVISIDFRGHGLSDLDWQKFSDDDFNRAVLDVKAAVSYLESKNISKIGIVGSSIGSSIGLKYAAQDDTVKSLVLLSPGIDYEGVNISTDVNRYSGAVLIVASNDDLQSALDSQSLFDSATGKKQLKLYESAGHGTNMFSKEDIFDLIISWLDETT